MVIKWILEWGNINPKKLFQIDAFGATLSAVLLGIVLVKLERFFGIPKHTLYFLSLLPCLFAIYDLYCYYKIDENLGGFLKTISIANLLYCCLSIGLTIYHKEKITYLGWIYIFAEIIVVCLLAFVELQVAKKQAKKKLSC